MKKRIIFVLLCVFASCGTVEVQQQKNTESQKFVSAESGLVLREGSGRSFGKITLIPFNSEITVKSKSDVSENISGKTGYWIKAEWINPKDNVRYEGWCFDAFLSNKKIIRDCDVVCDGDPLLDIKININYSMPIPTKKDPDEVENPSGAYESHWQNFIFLPDNKFTFSIKSMISYERGETFHDDIEYSGTYTIIDNTVQLRYLKCEKVSDCSSAEAETRQKIALSLQGCPKSFNTAETEEKCYLKSEKGNLYIYSKRSR